MANHKEKYKKRRASNQSKRIQNAKKKKKGKKEDSYQDTLPSNKVIKVRLDKILRSEHKGSINRFREFASRTNLIMTRGYDFIKTYCLYCFDNQVALPTFDKTTFMIFLKTVTKPTRKVNYKDDNKLLKERLDAFYDNHYSKCLIESERQSMAGLRQVIDYCSEEIRISFGNHINEHYYKFLCQYINTRSDKQKVEQKIRSTAGSMEEEKRKIKMFRKELAGIKSDIYHNVDTCDPKYDGLKADIRSRILQDLHPKHTLKGDQKQKIYSDPLKLYPSLIRMSKDAEKMTRDNLEDKEEMFKIINVFPLRTTCIPRYFKIDTIVLGNIFPKLIGDVSRNVEVNKGWVWKTIFKTDNRVFRKKRYRFCGSIQTDGYSASILFELAKNQRNVDTVENHNHFNHNLSFQNSLRDKQNDIYLDKLSDDDLDEIRDKNFVGIDPGKDDLIFCTDGRLKRYHPETGIRKRTGEKIESTILRQKVLEGKVSENVPENRRVSFRYSRIQRRRELKVKKYRDFRELDKSSTRIKGKTIKEWESELSDYNSNTCIYDNWIKYLRKKEEIRNIITDYYGKTIYRQLRWYEYLNKERSEMNMLDNFQLVFGDPTQTVIFYGDHSCDHTLRNQEPTKGRSMRRLFQKRGYRVYLIDEFRTSKMMFGKGIELEKFRKRDNPRPYKKDIRTVHGLLRTKSTNSGSSTRKDILINRDMNGALNILHKGQCIIEGKETPEYMDRSKCRTNEVQVDDVDNKVIIKVKGKNGKKVCAKKEKKVKVKRNILQA